jgi:hypothetical protein
MFAIILVAALAAPPQSTLPAESKCQCSPNCPCKAPATSAPTPKQTAEPPREVWMYQGVPHVQHADGVWRPTTNAVVPTTSGVVSGCPGGVCPVPQRKGGR